jgi:predicted signal transduction protein with EAL and GGDEF domain
VQWCERGRAANLDPDQLYANADQALYEAKAQGRDRAVVQRRTDPADTRTAAPAGTAA